MAMRTVRSEDHVPPVGESELPAKVVTKGGASFDPRLAHWSYRDGVTQVSLNFRLLRGFSRQLITAAKATFIWYAQHHAPASLVSSFGT